MLRRMALALGLALATCHGVPAFADCDPSAGWAAGTACTPASRIGVRLGSTDQSLQAAINAGTIGRGLTPRTVTSTATLAAGDLAQVNTTSGAFAVTLPAGPSDGSVIEIVDAAGTFDTNGLTINRGGSDTIEGSNSKVVSTEYAYVRLSYDSGLARWQMLDEAGGGGSGDVQQVWTATSGDVSGLVAGAGDTLDAGAASASSPFTRSTVLPATCLVGQVHQDTDSGGSQLYLCTAANTWSKLALLSEAGGVSDGDKTDITITVGGTVYTIDPLAVTAGKLANDAVSDSSKVAAGAIERTDHATSAVGAAALDEADVEPGLEAVLDLPDLQGAVTEAQTPLAGAARVLDQTSSETDIRYDASPNAFYFDQGGDGTRTLTGERDAGSVAFNDDVWIEEFAQSSSTLGLQEAINHVCTNSATEGYGARIRLRGTKYAFGTATISVPANCHGLIIQGSGPDMRDGTISPGTELVTTHTAGGFDFFTLPASIQRVKIIDLRVTVVDPAAATRVFVVGDLSTNVKFENVMIEPYFPALDADGVGIVFDDAVGCRVENSVIQGLGTGVLFTGTQNAGGCVISRNRIQAGITGASAAGVGVRIGQANAACSNIKLDSNEIEGSNIGVLVDTTTFGGYSCRVSLLANHFEQTSGTAPEDIRAVGANSIVAISNDFLIPSPTIGFHRTTATDAGATDVFIGNQHHNNITMDAGKCALFAYADKAAAANLSACSTIQEDEAIAFEGATLNAFKTTLSATDPTANRSIALPDASGTIPLIETPQAVTGAWDFGGGGLEIPNSTTLPATCTVGQQYMDTDATSGQRHYLCEATNTWVRQGDGVGGGGGALDDLTDVTITTPATGATLIYNGAAWIDGALDLADADARTGLLPLANGGLGADASGFTAGLLGLSGGALQDVDTWAEFAAALGISNTAVDASGNATFRTLVTSDLDGSNFIDLFDNGTGTPSCSSLILAGKVGMLDSDASASLALDVCNGTALLWRFPATSTTTTQALFATGTAGAPAFRALATGDLPAGATLDTEWDTSDEIRAAMSDEIGTGALMFGLISTMADDLACTGSQVVRRNAGDTAFECATVSAGGAPTDADYLVGTANGSLSAEIVVGTSPGGELGGTWASPTIDDGITVDAINLTSANIQPFTSTAPAPTAEGMINWEGDDDHLIVGDGAAQVEFVPAEDVSGDATMTDAGVLEVTQADALETNGTNCGAGQAAQGIDTAGNAEGCFTPGGGGLTHPQVMSRISIGF